LKVSWDALELLVRKVASFSRAEERDMPGREGSRGTPRQQGSQKIGKQSALCLAFNALSLPHVSHTNGIS
jgi:hypothetical protein